MALNRRAAAVDRMILGHPSSADSHSRDDPCRWWWPVGEQDPVVAPVVTPIVVPGEALADPEPFPLTPDDAPVPPRVVSATAVSTS